MDMNVDDIAALRKMIEHYGPDIVFDAVDEIALELGFEPTEDESETETYSTDSGDSENTSDTSD